MTRFRIGTRKSTMALAQTEEIARRLQAAIPSLDIEIVKFETTGDSDQTSKLLTHGGKGGAFVAEIRRAMLDGRLHAAMHSLKDMPGNEETPGLVIAALLSRDPPGDVLVLRRGLSLDEFRKDGGRGFKIGTNAVRRAAYARRLFPQAELIHFRGAADTRIRKLDNGELQRLPDGGAVGPADALIMARSGLERVGLSDRASFDFAAGGWAGHRRGRVPVPGLGDAAHPRDDRRWRSAKLRRRGARGAVGAQWALQFADRGLRDHRQGPDDLDRLSARRGWRPLHRSPARRSR